MKRKLSSKVNGGSSSQLQFPVLNGTH